MIRRPPRSTRTYTLFPYTTLFRSIEKAGKQKAISVLIDKKRKEDPEFGQCISDLNDATFEVLEGNHPELVKQASEDFMKSIPEVTKENFKEIKTMKQYGQE